MDAKASSISRQFNRSAAGSYDVHARVQLVMADKLASSLRGRNGAAGAAEPELLEIGCGTGILTEMLLRNWPGSSITALDIAQAMIEAAERRIRSIGQPHGIRFVLADVEAWAFEAPQSSFDLIVSNACFQWLRNPHDTLIALRRLLRPGGTLAFATFGPDTFRELHESFAEAYHASGKEPQRHGLSFQSAADWQTMLREAGFSSTKYERSLEVETHASVRDFLNAVKAVGANASEAAPRGLGSRQLFTKMLKRYEEKFGIPGGIAASYDIFYIHATSPLDHEKSATLPCISRS
ncbi:malonyl-ACP O-methyltransferase BioC [Paenibacillus alkaliterrae]|uniref:malonyl-ACP O-methyltransferase BioC n=1 Tax=Paenibacillus alkaliterrae TaxID=320909 RepID=UPI001F4113B4|nr:malonyl-ACP O-methyltransferase BioC [Paenibacillus alkaliterrae]MCF2938078.1 malonyl-ACP O-methyltransferase BioC [Paenibacillus alkaliterrae]